MHEAACTDKVTVTHTHTHTLSLSFSLSLTHTLSLSITHTLSHSLAHRICSGKWALIRSTMSGETAIFNETTFITTSIVGILSREEMGTDGVQVYVQ